MDNEYKTTDQYIAAVLISCNFLVLRVESNKRNVKKFVFEKTDELTSAIMKYMNGELVGNIRDFRNALEAVKDMIHNE